MSDNKQPTKQSNSAKIIANVEDGGQFGFLSCGSCSALLKEDPPLYCPECGAKLEGVELGPNYGGSDF